MSKKAKIITYGCAMNVNESAKIKKELENKGYEIIDELNEADIVFLNTCTIREGAAEKVYGKLGQLKTLKKKKKDLIVGVTGCLAQEQSEDLIKKAPHINMVLGNQNIYKISEYLDEINNEKIKNVVLIEDEDILPPTLEAHFDSDITASISITYGCNNFCSYCIVPYVRGRERSVPLEEILKEIKIYIKKGYKEILLLGQNVNSYGKDLENTSFSKLLKEICKIDSKFRLRFISPHPRDFTDDVIDVVAEEEKICKSIHLPLQSGATEIIKKMNRGYTKEQYLELAEKIKTKVKEVSLTTDIIVGFPGETEKDFEDTMDVVKKVRYENAFTFMYSKRKGTPAAIMENQVSEEIKKERLQKLIELQRKITGELSKEYQDKVVEILVEGPTKKNKENYYGRTDTNKIVIIKKDEKVKGKFVNVKINEVRTWTLYGEIV